jgi:hypothetical protein
LASSSGALKSMWESLLELSPGSASRSLALTRSDRGGARLGVRAVAGLEAGDDAESGAWELDGAELAGAEFCAHAPRLHANNKIKSKLRIEVILPS